MIPYCNDTGVGLIPWSPIARGALARPFHTRDTLREKSDNFMRFVPFPSFGYIFPAN
jgi:versiconal hemiacetal acetate reductase